MKTILLVDDEYAIVEILGRILEDEGYRVVSATNAKDGIERVGKEAPDLVIVDYMMPLGGGRELVQELRALPGHEATPVIMVSAAAKEVATSNGRGGVLDVAAFLGKPFPLDDLLETIARLIGKGDKDGAPRPKGGTIH